MGSSIGYEERDGNVWRVPTSRKKHPTQYQATMVELGTSVERKVPVAVALGEEVTRKLKKMNIAIKHLSFILITSG